MSTWAEDGRYVLESLKRQERQLDELDKKMDRLMERTARLEVKAGLWGGLIAAIVAGVAKAIS